ncbi:MAG: hypothetical protein WAV76_00290, partial [Bacteroidota bacterium]
IIGCAVLLLTNNKSLISFVIPTPAIPYPWQANPPKPAVYPAAGFLFALFYWLSKDLGTNFK